MYVRCMVVEGLAIPRGAGRGRRVHSLLRSDSVCLAQSLQSHVHVMWRPFVLACRNEKHARRLEPRMTSTRPFLVDAS